MVRTSLLPGLLKTIRENRSHALPIRIFETSDVVFKDVTRERQTRNVRHAAAVWCNKTAGFEIVHGLLDRAMAMLEVPHIPGGSGGGNQAASTRGYYLKERSGTSVVSSDDELHLSFPYFFWSCLGPKTQTRHSFPVAPQQFTIAWGPPRKLSQGQGRM